MQILQFYIQIIVITGISVMVVAESWMSSSRIGFQLEADVVGKKRWGGRSTLREEAWGRADSWVRPAWELLIGRWRCIELEVELEAVKHHIKLRSHIGVCWNRKPGHIDFGV
jgi:hypothetical protein